MPAYATISPDTGIYLPGSAVSYKCAIGHTLTDGNITRYCLNSSWTGIPPLCICKDYFKFNKPVIFFYFILNLCQLVLFLSKQPQMNYFMHDKNSQLVFNCTISYGTIDDSAHINNGNIDLGNFFHFPLTTLESGDIFYHMQ